MKSITTDPWRGLRNLTPARIALGRAGSSLPTAAHLAFQLDHARARQAVHHELGADFLTGLAATGLEVLPIASAAVDRATYLQRPDLGRRLSDGSRATLAARPVSPAYDVAFVIGDGLSALALEENAAGFLAVILGQVRRAGWSVAPLAVVTQARVAVADEVAQSLGAAQVVMLIGERPGLSSPDSMGIYFTHAPRAGMTDESRNCISNVRQAGMSYRDAATTLWFLMREARRRGISGVGLKDDGVTAINDHEPSDE